MPRTQKIPEQEELSADFDTRTAQYVKLRDRIKEITDKHAEELKPFKEAKELLEQYFLAELERMNVSSVKGGHGTVYKTMRASATVADGAAFRAYVEETGAWELCDIRANAPAVRDFIEANGTPPAGVNFSNTVTVGCRRAGEK